MASVLLYGPEGCGKSLVAGAFLGEARTRNVAEIRGPELLARPERLWDIEKALTRFELRHLLIENVDLLFEGLRGAPGARVGLIELLSVEREGYAVCTARYPEKLQPEELGAFKHVIPLLYPTAVDRGAIVAKVTNLTSDCASELAEQMEWWSSREIVECAKKVNGCGDADRYQTIEVYRSRIDVAARKRRARELMTWTEAHCSSPELRDAVRRAFGGGVLAAAIDSVELKPSAFGLSMDVKALLAKLLTRMRRRN